MARRALIIGSVVVALTAPSAALVAPTAASAAAGTGVDQARAERLGSRHAPRTAAPSRHTTAAPRSKAADGVTTAQDCVIPIVASLADRVVVTWGPYPPGTAVSFRVLRQEPFASWSLLATVPGTSTQFTDRTMPQDWPYASYLVQAVYPNGSRSSTACDTTGQRDADAVFSTPAGLLQGSTELPNPAVPLQPGGEAYSPAYSPDGTRVVYAWAPDATSPTTLWARRADGLGSPVQLAAAADGAHDLSTPAWSPDGRSVAATDVEYSSGGDVLATHLVRVDLAARRRTDVPGSADLASPSWTSTSTEVVAADLSSASAPLVRLDVARGTRRAVPGTTAGDEPDVSPDGRQVLFTTWTGDPADPVVLRRAALTGTTAPSTVRTGPVGGDLWSPRWSADGRRVLWLEMSAEGVFSWRSAAPDGSQGSGLNLWVDATDGIDGFDVRDRPDPGTSDFTGDGWNDVLATDAKGDLWLYPGRSSTSLPVRPFGTRIKVGSGWGSMSLIEAAGDLTGDGLPDVVARDRSGYLWLYPTRHALTSPGGWSPRRRYGGGWNAMTALMGVGDWNGDGHADLLAATRTGDMRLYTGDGLGGLHGGTRIGRGFASWSLLEGVGDLGGDGHVGIVGRNTKGELWLFRSAGVSSGRFLPSRRLGTGWQSMTALVGPEAWVFSAVALIARDRYGRMWVYGEVHGRLQGGPAPYGSGWNAMRTITS